MGKLRAGLGTPLSEVVLLDDWHLRKLRALSVTTVEELLGLIAADPDTIPSFLEVTNLAQLQADARPLTSAAIMNEQDRVGSPLHSKGARRPAAIEEEFQADFATFETLLQTFEIAPSALAAGESRDLIDGFGPIRSQGDRGTCVAYAGCAVLEYLLRNVSGEWVDLSEQFLYWKSKQLDGIPNESGTFLEVAMPSLVTHGTCLESTWPYRDVPVPGNEGQGPPPPSAVTDALDLRAQHSQAHAPRSSTGLRRMVDEGRPVAIPVPVFRNWDSNPNTNAYGLIPMPLPNSVLTGGHAMCVVGYAQDDDFPGGGGFILRNSWGTDWAPRSPVLPGYGVIPFAYIDLYAWEAFSLDTAVK